MLGAISGISVVSAVSVTLASGPVLFDVCSFAIPKFPEEPILVIKAGEVHSFRCIGDGPLVQVDVHVSPRFIRENLG